mmetsp:Transcript_9642/g.28887  ORF Transcript_9642/g.28887 Transcript_9642/m.28887 type:complete len:100 (+) Transcript_9642:278-577(+)
MRIAKKFVRRTTTLLSRRMLAKFIRTGKTKKSTMVGNRTALRPRFRCSVYTPGKKLNRYSIVDFSAKDRFNEVIMDFQWAQGQWSHWYICVYRLILVNS